MKRKRNIEFQILIYKKFKKTAEKFIIINETFPLAIRFKNTEQNLETKKKNFLIFEKKIDTLKKRKIILITRFQAREEIINN
jgi:hypothetical protein